MAKAATPRPLADGSRSSDESLPASGRRPLRLAASDDVCNELRELRRRFLALRDEGDFPAYRVQFAPTGELPDRLQGLVESLRDVPSIRQRRWSFAQRRSPSNEGEIFLCERYFLENGALRELFGRLSIKLGFGVSGSGYHRGFPAVFRFLDAVLTFPPARVRCRTRRFVPWTIEVLEGGAVQFGTSHEIEHGFVYDRTGPLQYADADSVEPLFFVTEIAGTCFAVSEVLDALLDGRLAQRSFPFACPWTDDPFSPPGAEVIRDFADRRGFELAVSQESLAHVLRTFYEPADPPATVGGPTLPQRDEPTPTLNWLWTAHGELDANVSRFGGRAFRQWADDARRRIEAVPALPRRVPNFDALPAVRDEFERCLEWFRRRADAGDVATYRIQATSDGALRGRRFAGALDEGFGARRLDSVCRIFRASEPQRMRRIVYVRGDEGAEISSLDRQLFEAAGRALGVFADGERKPLIDWLDFVHGFGWFPFDALPYRAERFVADGIFGPVDRQNPGGRRQDADGLAGRLNFCNYGPPHYVRSDQVIENWLEPAVFVSVLPDTFAACAAAIRALLGGSLAQAPILANVIDPNEYGALAQDVGSHVVDWVRTGQELLWKFYREPSADPATVAISTPREGNASEKENGEADAAPSSGIAGVEAKPAAPSSRRKGRRKSGTGRPAKYDVAFIAALTSHHYRNGRCEVFEPIENSDMLASAENCKANAVTRFFDRKFQGSGRPRQRYKNACRGRSALIAALMRLNQEAPSAEALGIDLDKLRRDD